MRIFISIFILSFIYSQHPVETKEFYIHKEDKITKINVLDFVSGETNDGLFEVEIIGMNNLKYGRKRITLVMPCEIEMSISSDLSNLPIDFKICNDKVASSGTLLIDKTNPNIYINQEKFNFINGTFIIRISGHFDNSKKTSNNIDNNGILREWYENDQLFLEFNMINGIKNGICKKWHNNGQLMQSYNYDRGKLHGIQKKWYSNGKLKAEWNYKNDVLNGISSEWHEDGKVKSIKEYRDGELVSSNY